MTPSRQRVALVGAMVLSACGSPVPPAPEAPASVSAAERLPLGPARGDAETFSWRMVVRGVEVAQFDLRASSVADVVRVVSRGSVRGVARFFRTFDAQAVAIIERVTGRNRTALRETRGQGAFRRTSLRFGRSAAHGIVGDGETSRAFERRSISNLAPLSSEAFLLALRQWRPKRGERAISVVQGASELWLIELRAHAARMTSAPIGDRRAQELVGSAKRLAADGTLANARPRPLTIFISDDADRLPLRVESKIGAASIKLELLSYAKR